MCNFCNDHNVVSEPIFPLDFYDECYEDIDKVFRFKATWWLLFSTIFMFSHISLKMLHIEYPFQSEIGDFEV